MAVEQLNSVMSQRACPTCGGHEALLLHEIEMTLPDDSVTESSYKAVVCKRCTTAYCDTSVSEAQLNSYYQLLAKYSDKTVGTGGRIDPFDSHRLNALAEFLDSSIPSKDFHILDIGCANGGLLEILWDLGYKNIYGLDPSRACVDEVKKRLDISVEQGNIADVGVFGKKFDVIILSHVVEHLLNPKDAVRSLQSHLSDRGLLYVEVPDAESYYRYESTPFQEFNTEHLNHFAQSTLQFLVESCGFETQMMGHRLSMLSADFKYPAVFGIWKAAPHRSPPIPEFNMNVLTAIIKYRDRSLVQLEKIVDHLNKNLPENFSLWGAGQFTYKLLAIPALAKRKPRQIVDNNSINWGRALASCEIQKPAELEKQTQCVLIGSVISSESITKQIARIHEGISVIDLSRITDLQA